MAALMTYINPGDDAAFFDWWKKKMEALSGLKVRESLADWTTRYVLRREKDVIAHLLKKKVVRTETIYEPFLGT